MQLDASRIYKCLTEGFTPPSVVINLTRENKNMSKKQKKNNFYSHDLYLTIDSLAYTPDEELRNLHDSLRKERDMTVREGFDSHDVETSICYVQRELSVRESRRAAHVAYIKANNISVDLPDQIDNGQNEVAPQEEMN